MKRTPILAISCLLYSTSFLPGQGGDLDPSMLNGSLSSLGAPQRSMKAISQVDPGTPLPTLDGGALSSFPLTITTPGHYYLTRNVTLDPTGGAAITINADDVALDLRGFALIGSGGAGTLDTHSGIRVSASRATIRKGNITGSWYSGIFSDTSTTVCENLAVAGSASYGIHTGDNARLFNCSVDGTSAAGFITTAGIETGDYSALQSSSAFSCDGVGFNTGAYCQVINCISFSNASTGFFPGHNSRFTACISISNSSGYSGQFISGVSFVECFAIGNDFHGFFYAGNRFERCAAFSNGLNGFNVSNASVIDCLASFNDSAGFLLYDSCTVSGCVARSNESDGFVTSGPTRSGSNIDNCVSANNGSLIGNPLADGFEMAKRCRLVNSLSYDNRGAGVRTTDRPNVIKGNFLYSNDSGGIVLGPDPTANLVIGNLSTSQASGNYSHTGGNIGPVESASLGTSPHANFQ